MKYLKRIFENKLLNHKDYELEDRLVEFEDLGLEVKVKNILYGKAIMIIIRKKGVSIEIGHNPSIPFQINEKTFKEILESLFYYLDNEKLKCHSIMLKLTDFNKGYYYNHNKFKSLVLDEANLHGIREIEIYIEINK